MLEGTVKWFNPNKGFGFIRPKNGSGDIFVHINDVNDSGYETLLEKEEVEFDIQTDRQGRVSATNITAFEYA